jgi:hypothetical protein
MKQGWWVFQGQFDIESPTLSVSPEQGLDDVFSLPTKTFCVVPCTEYHFDVRSNMERQAIILCVGVELHIRLSAHHSLYLAC